MVREKKRDERKDEQSLSLKATVLPFDRSSPLSPRNRRNSNGERLRNVLEEVERDRTRMGVGRRGGSADLIQSPFAFSFFIHLVIGPKCVDL